MADKEATVYIVDVGKSMSQKNNGRDETDLEWGMKYVWDKIADTVLTGRKTAGIGVLGLRDDDTDHPLSGSEGYENIKVYQPIAQCTLPILRELRQKIIPSTTDDGDAISALVVAIDMIEKHCKHLKYQKRIELFTNGKGSMDADQLSDIAEKIKGENIQLIIIGVDFDDLDYPFKEEDKDLVKAENENTLSQLAEQCDGVFGTVAQAVEELGTPRTKTIRPVPSFKGRMTLGDPKEYESALVIDVERYPCIMVAKAPSASSFVVKTRSGMIESTQSSATVMGDDEHNRNPNELAAVHNDRTYEIIDSNDPQQKKELGRESLARGYEYGRTIVPISESDQNVTNLETFASLDILGFVPKDHFNRYMSMTNTHMILAQRTNEKAKIAMSSFVHALHEMQSYAIARLVVKDGKDPQMLALTPHIEVDFECLHDAELPFTEDVRAYTFPPLDRIVTVSGKVLTEHRNLPSKELQHAMDDFVEQMDLSTYARDEEGQPCEYMPLEETFSPLLHRLNQAIRFRATYPDRKIPDPYNILVRYNNPPQDLMSSSASAIANLEAAADVKKVPPKTLSRRVNKTARPVEAPRSGLDVAALLSSRSSNQTPNIDPHNAIPEFKQLVAAATDISTFHTAVAQFGEIIRDWIRHSVGDSGYDRAVEGIGALRKECFEMEEPGVFNEFMVRLKADLLAGQLGGERREMWWAVRRARVGLIERRVCAGSTVEDEEARLFLAAK